MSCTELTAKYAPSLLHLAEQLDAFDSVIPGHAAGPVPEAKCPGGKEPHIMIQLWEQYGQSPIVIIYSEESCIVHTEGDAPFPITFQRLLEYLEQLPKPIWAFMN